MRSQSIRYRCVCALLYENNRLDTEPISAMSEADRYNSNMVENFENMISHCIPFFLRPRYVTQMAENRI